jgi:hypothetical protein
MQVIRGNVASKPYALTDAATIATDAALSNVFSVTLGGNRTLGNPTSLVDGMFLTWLVNNGATPFTLAYDTMFKWGKGGTGSAPALSTTASKVHLISGVYDATSGTILAALLDTSGVAAAGSKTYAVLTPMTSQPPAANFATLDTRNSVAVLDFDDTTAEGATWVTSLPEGAVLTSGLKFTIHNFNTSGVANAAVWEVSVERMNTDIDADSFDTVATGSAAANATSGIKTSTTITLTTIDSAVAQDPIRVKVRRLPADAGDTMTGDAELFAVEVWSAA